MRHLPILIGDHTAQSVQPVHEPYRVVWNTSVVFNEQTKYFEQKQEGRFRSSILNTTILTDHEPLGFEPKMLMLDFLPLDITITGYPVFTASRPKYPVVGMRVNRIHEIASANRKGILPKVFQSRFVSTVIFEEMDYYRYNLDAAGTKYLSLRLVRDAVSLRARLRYCLDGQSVINSAYAEIEDSPTGTVSTDSLRLIIFGNHLEFHLSDPGDKLLELTFLEDVNSSSTSFLEMIREEETEDGQDTPVLYAIDGLYVYDGYY